MNKYSELNLKKRLQIKVQLEADHNKSEIARIIGVHRSTIIRELNCNVANNGGEPNTYCPGTARKLTDQRHRSKLKHRRFSEQLKHRLVGG